MTLHATASPPPPATGSTAVVRIMQTAMHVLFCVLVVAGFTRALSDGDTIVGTVLGTAIFLAVYLAGIAIERRSASPGAGQVWITALVTAWVALLFVAPAFVWVAFALYFLVLHVAGRALRVALVLVVLIAGIVAAGSVVGPTIGMVVAVGIAWIYAQLRAESAARQRLVDELLAAQEDVLAAQEELARTQHEAGVLAERSRLARDIHDTLAQSFSSIVLLSRAGLARSRQGQTLDVGLLEQIDDVASSGLSDAREVVAALTPSELAAAPLPAALDRLLTRLGEQSAITTELTVDGEPRTLPTSTDVTLLRVAQGALANARLHSQADRVHLTLAYDATVVRLEVIDDGIGFTDRDVERAPLSGSGFGLRAIRERVSELGGTVDIESAPGEGTAVVATIPVNGGLT